MPRVKLTRTARVSLGILMFYLVFLILLLGVKFLRVLREGSREPASRPTAQARVAMPEGARTRA